MSRRRRASRLVDPTASLMAGRGLPGPLEDRVEGWRAWPRTILFGIVLVVAGWFPLSPVYVLGGS